MSDQTELDAAISALRQIAGAAHFTPTREDYMLVDRVFDLSVQSRVLVELLATHPELKEEASALAQAAAQDRHSTTTTNEVSR
jgi:hypothetical protein